MNHADTKQTSGKIGFISLGCPKALVDSERILTILSEEGYKIEPTYENADIVIINTCGFIEDAVEESLDTIDEALQRNGKVIVTGCLGAKDGIVEKEFPNVLAVTGPHAAREVVDAVHQHLPPAPNPYIDLLPPSGIKLTPTHYAYLKISEGCNHRCRFCIIPSLRGDLVSRPINEVLDEAIRLQESGVRELLVISQDTSAYGVDLKYGPEIWQGQALKTRLFDLAKTLGDLDMWIRLHYIYPYPTVDDLIPLMAEGKILPYLDIPFQHASPRILKSMKRPANTENALKRIRKWRQICPEIKIRSTFIVGFPGETAEDFSHLLDFLDEAQLDRVGCFPYSAVDGAAANKLDDPVAEELKRERQQIFMQTQAEISAHKLDAMIGKELQIIIDHIEDDHVIGRSYGEAPEIDGVIVVESNQEFEIGDFTEVKIINADEHDLFAELT